MPCFRGVFRGQIFVKTSINVKIGKIARSAKIMGILDLKYLKMDRKWQKKSILRHFLWIFVLQMELIFARFSGFWGKAYLCRMPWHRLPARILTVEKGGIDHFLKNL